MTDVNLRNSHQAKLVWGSQGWTVKCEVCGQLTDWWARPELATQKIKDHKVKG